MVHVHLLAKFALVFRSQGLGHVPLRRFGFAVVTTACCWVLCKLALIMVFLQA